MRGTSVIALAPAAAVIITGPGPAIDIGGYTGPALLHLNAGPTDAGTATIKLQHSDDGAAGWTDVDRMAFTAAATDGIEETLKLNASALRRFVRVLDTLTGATTVVRSVTLIGHKQYSE